MPNPYYNASGYPSTGAPASSSSMRSELSAIASGFDKMPTLSGAGTQFVVVNSGGTGLTTAGAGMSYDGSTLNVSVNNSVDAVRITQTGTGNALVVEDSTNPDSTPVVVDANGILVVGDTVNRNNSYRLQSIGTNGGDFLSQRWTNGATGSFWRMQRSRGATVGTFSALLDNDFVGAVLFDGDDGSAFGSVAGIYAVADGNLSSGSTPGMLQFRTTASGTNSPVARMWIDNQGRVCIGTAGPTVGTAIRVSNSITGATTAYGLFVNPTTQSDVTASSQLVRATTATAAASFTLTDLYAFRAAQGTFGAGSTVTNQYGFGVDASLTGATNNYAFYANVGASSVTAGSFVVGQTYKITSVGTTSFTSIGASSNTVGTTFTATGAGTGTGTANLVGRYNFFANGTAENVFNGNTIINVSSGLDALRVTQTGTGNAIVVEDSTNPDSSPFVVDTNGRTMIGHTASMAAPLAGNLQVLGTTSATAAIGRFSNDVNAGDLRFFKSRSSTLGTAGTVLSAGDLLGAIRFYGDDGSATGVQGAYITASPDNAPSSGVMPTALYFYTSDTGGVLNEGMRIDSGSTVIMSKLRVSASSFSEMVAIRNTGTGPGVLLNSLASYTTTVSTASSATPHFQQHGASSTTTAVQGLFAWNNTNPYFAFSKAGTGGIGTHALVASGDLLGAIQFNGSNGTSFVPAALISAAVDGTPGASNDMPGRLVFSTTVDGGGSILAERMRIDNSGAVMIGTTSQRGTAGLTIIPNTSAGAADITFNRTTTTSSSFVLGFQNAGTTVGYVSYTNTTVTYNTGSDARLKDNIVDAGDAGTIIDGIQIRAFDWKAGGHQRYGVVAQELINVFPEAVSDPEADGRDDLPMAVDYSKMVPMLIKEIQSLRARVAALEP